MTFYAVSLRDKLGILLWCIRWLFVTRATLTIPDRMVWCQAKPLDVAGLETTAVQLLVAELLNAQVPNDKAKGRE